MTRRRAARPAPMPRTLRVIPFDEWKAEGERRFGPDVTKWRFVCPGCNNEQSVEDFRPFKDHGATPSSAYGQCLGRFLPRAQTRSWANDKPRPGVRCDYTASGLLCLCTTRVQPSSDVTADQGPQPIPVFEFGKPAAAGAREAHP
jgi:hypothetical protein